jgi:hypothetical protein
VIQSGDGPIGAVSRFDTMLSMPILQGVPEHGGGPKATAALLGWPHAMNPTGRRNTTRMRLVAIHAPAINLGSGGARHRPSRPLPEGQMDWTFALFLMVTACYVIKW